MCSLYRLGAWNCTRTRVERSVRHARDGKSHYLDLLLFVLALPLVRSHREVEFRLDVVHICKRCKEMEVKKSILRATNRPRSRDVAGIRSDDKTLAYVPHSSSMAADDYLPCVVPAGERRACRTNVVTTRTTGIERAILHEGSSVPA